MDYFKDTLLLYCVFSRTLLSNLLHTIKYGIILSLLKRRRYGTAE